MTEANKTVVRRLVDEVFNGGQLEVIDELYTPELAGRPEQWIAPFRASFPDVHMEIVELIAEADKVVGRFTCSATHLGEWLGQVPTGRRFERVDEVSIFRFRDGKIVHAWTLEDTLSGSSSSAWLSASPADQAGVERDRQRVTSSSNPPTVSNAAPIPAGQPVEVVRRIREDVDTRVQQLLGELVPADA